MRELFALSIIIAGLIAIPAPSYASETSCDAKKLDLKELDPNIPEKTEKIARDADSPGYLDSRASWLLAEKGAKEKEKAKGKEKERETSLSESESVSESGSQTDEIISDADLDNWNRLIAEGDAAFRAEQYSGAARAYRECLKLQDTALVRERLAKAYYFSGNNDEALSQFRAALSLQPDNADMWKDLAWLLCQRSEFREAVKYANMCVSARPDDADSYVLLGYAYGSLNNNDSALRALDRAIELQPDNSLAHIYKGDVLMSMSEFEKAKDSYDFALGIDSSSLAAYLGRGNALARLKRPDESMDAYKLAVNLAPHDPEALGRLGAAMFQSGNWVSGFKLGLAANANRLEQSWDGFVGMLVSVWAGLFILFGVIFGAIVAGSRFKPQPNETVLKSFFLVFHKDRPGRFVVTDRRLVFVPELVSQSFGSTRVSIERSAVDKIILMTQSNSNKIKIVAKTGSEHLFSMPQLVYEPLEKLLVEQAILLEGIEDMESASKNDSGPSLDIEPSVIDSSEDNDKSSLSDPENEYDSQSQSTEMTIAESLDFRNSNASKELEEPSDTIEQAEIDNTESINERSEKDENENSSKSE